MLLIKTTHVKQNSMGEHLRSCSPACHQLGANKLSKKKIVYNTVCTVVTQLCKKIFFN